jgi:hypothetical protein
MSAVAYWAHVLGARLHIAHVQRMHIHTASSTGLRLRDSVTLLPNTYVHILNINTDTVLQCVQSVAFAHG